ncbi:hypothetical protein [Arthrobacter sp. B10-11]|uniref:hypothetical protein n=1 Tax=Arthrobacter sp. B10-11 TaxID=3081160 RepID=UPI002953F772|nr:hypothetical protein [Arthrobacter sp. B10-11]MDV8147395.1 hypothetical protein [Arthrobacter sp. B10-11]
MVDLWGEGIPNWVVAGTSFFTLLAAVAAGYFASRAAHYTKEQAAASHEQVRIGDEALKIAQEDALAAQDASLRQRREAEQAYRNFAESRLDALAPVVLASATPYDTTTAGGHATKLWLEVHRLEEPNTAAGYDRWSDWKPVTATFYESAESGVVFQTQLVIRFNNVSDKVARIDVIDPGNGELEDPSSGARLILMPHETKSFVWTKRWGLPMLATEDDLNDPKNWLFNLEFWVRDLGMNVRDTHKFNGDLRLFERDGSRLMVKAKPLVAWPENVDIATPMPGRVYERLVAEDLQATQ